MKTTVKVLVVIIILASLCKAIGYIQDDHLECPVTEVTETTVTFQAYGDNAYVWECDNTSEFAVGDIYKVDFFDFENYDATDNVIVKVGAKLN